MTHKILLIVVMTLVTMLTRFLPFWLLGSYLGKVLPYAIMGMLVVYCLKGVSFLFAPYGLPEILGVAAVVGLHVWKRNTLLSIAGGTVFYMILVQLVF